MWIAIEEPITDGEVAGTVDRIGRVKSITVPMVVDIKSSSRIYELSVSAQTYKYGEMYSKPCVPYSLHLKDNGTYEFRQLDIAKGRRHGMSATNYTSYWRYAKMGNEMIVYANNTNYHQKFRQ